MTHAGSIRKAIPKLYKSNALNLLMLGYVQGMQDALPAITDDKALQMFMRHYRLTDEDFSLESAKVYFVTMKKAFLEI